MGWWHLTQGLWFQRRLDGSVRIVKTNGAMPDSKSHGLDVLFDITTDADGWASTIATMSAHGEADGGFDRAVAFHEEPK